MHMARVIGHRGCGGWAPENTLAGLREADRMGCRWVEVDATLLADGTLVLFHDDELSRCTSQSGAVGQLDWTQASRLDVGNWFGDGRFAGETIPRLEDALTLCQELGLGVNIELKTHADEGKELGAAVARHLSQDGPDVLVSSFDFLALETFHENNPACVLGLLYEELPQDWQAQAEALGAVSIHVDAQALTRAQIEAVKKTGYEFYVFTVNDLGEAKRLWDMGVDGVFSDFPDQILKSD